MGLAVDSFPQPARAGQAEGIAAVGAIGALGSMFCWTAANAESDESSQSEYARRGALLGAEVAYGIETYESDLPSSLRTISSDLNLSANNSFGIKGRAGYRCNRYASAEIQVEWLHSYDGKVFEDGVGKIARLDIEPIVATVNARGYVPIGDERIQPFALLGGGLVTVKTKLRDTTGLGLTSSERTTEVAIRVGGGVDFYATPNIVLTLAVDYLHAFGDLDGFNYVSTSMGMLYRF